MWEMSGLSMMFISPAVNSLRSRSSNFMGSQTCSNLRYSCGQKSPIVAQHLAQPRFFPPLTCWPFEILSHWPVHVIPETVPGPYLPTHKPLSLLIKELQVPKRQLGLESSMKARKGSAMHGAACLWTGAGTRSTRRVPRKSSLIFRTSESSWAFWRLTSSAPSNCACLRASSSCSSDSAMSVSTSTEATPTCWFAPAMELSDITETSESESSSVGTTGVSSFTPCECSAA